MPNQDKVNDLCLHAFGHFCFFSSNPKNLMTFACRSVFAPFCSVVVDLCGHLNPRGRFRCNTAAVFQGPPGASNEGSGEAVSGFFFGCIHCQLLLGCMANVWWQWISDQSDSLKLRRLGSCHVRGGFGCLFYPMSHFSLSVCICSVLLPARLDQREWLGCQGWRWGISMKDIQWLTSMKTFYIKRCSVETIKY